MSAVDWDRLEREMTAHEWSDPGLAGLARRTAPDTTGPGWWTWVGIIAAQILGLAAIGAVLDWAF